MFQFISNWILLFPSNILFIKPERKFGVVDMLESKKSNLLNFQLNPPKIQKLIFGRLALIFSMLLAVWWWKNTYLGLAAEEFPSSLFLLFIVSIGLSIVYFALLKFNLNLLLQVRIQFVIDAFLITGFVWKTGDLLSPYIILYLILIGASGFYLGNLGTLFISVLSAFCFTLLPFLTSQTNIFAFSGETRPSRLLQAIGFNTVAILVVGLLASRFSERRQVDQKIIEAAENFEDLHVLHERIVESIHSGLITTNLDGKIYAFNRTAEEISGLKASEIIGKSIFDIFGEEIQTPIEVCLGSVQSDDFRAEHFEASLISKCENRKANFVTVACSISPLNGKNGSVSGLILTFQDITKIRIMEETLRRSDRLAAVGRMAAGLAHEIRNPLGSMSSALQFLQDKNTNKADDSGLIDLVLKESDRLNEIITNFLAYSRPNYDSLFRENCNLLDVGETIEDCLLLLRHNPDISVNHQFDFEMPKTPVRIKANESQLKQIFWNLTKNSLKAMPDGGKFSVKLHEISDKNVQIIFEDTGLGINPDYLEQLFEPFSSKANGTGLGLSIVHKIVNDHNGRIDVQSQLGKGTKITIELPQSV